MLPGFIPRLHVELLRAISPPPPPPSRQPTKHDKAPPPHYDRYATLRPLIPYLSILNNPSPPAPLSDRAKNNGGKAPAFSPATMAWVGGSLAGYVYRTYHFGHLYSNRCLHDIEPSKLGERRSVARNGMKLILKWKIRIHRCQKPQREVVQRSSKLAPCRFLHRATFFQIGLDCRYQWVRRRLVLVLLVSKVSRLPL